MWGGVKKRTHYGDLFRQWSGSRGLEEVRIALYKEPRPWFLAYALDQHQHLLQDHHCARLLSWSTSIVELRPRLAEKQEAYRYTQEMFQMFMHHHTVGKETLREYMRLCAVGRDLTSAFDWFKYWQEAQLADAAALHTLTWLLCIAKVSPSEERTEDMALTVLDMYTQRFAGGAQAAGPASSSSVDTEAGTLGIQHHQPTTPEEAEDLRRFLCTFKSLEPRLRDSARLQAFLTTIPISLRDAETTCTKVGWPVDSPHRLFPHLEQHIEHVRHDGTTTHGDDGDEELDVIPSQFDSWARKRSRLPKLRDSLLHSDFVKQLDESASQYRVSEVVVLVEKYEQCIQEEQRRLSGDKTPLLRARSPADEVWKRCSDPAATAFRRKVVRDGGVTPELYHYLITALAATQPTAALRTLRRMQESNLRPLDFTRTAVLVAVRDAAEEQQRLFQEQLAEMDLRTHLDADYGTVSAVEAYWKFDYAAFFHHRNALTPAQFYLLLMSHLGPQRVQQLLLDAQRHGAAAATEDAVVLDDDLRRAARHYFRAQVGSASVDAALDAISTHMPRLDISLVGTLPHFENYYMEAADDIAHSEAALQKLLQPYHTIYVLDSSFVETSESFLSLGAASSSSSSPPSSSRSLVLIPYLCLAQLGASVNSKERFVSFDPALQQAIRTEVFLASQRLRSLLAMITSGSSLSSTSERETSEAGQSVSSHRRVRVLHFTECLCANRVEADVLQALHLSPATKDNDHLLLVLAMLSSLKTPSARLVFCTDDSQSVEQLESLKNSSLFGSAVEVVRTAPPENFDLEHNLVNDNPVWRDGGWMAGERDVPDDDESHFDARLRVVADVPAGAGAEQRSSHFLAAGKAVASENRNQPILENGNATPLTADAAVKSDDESAEAALAESPWLALLDQDDSATIATTAIGNDEAEAAAAPSPTSASASAPTESASPVVPPLMSPAHKAALTTVAAQEAVNVTRTSRDRLMDVYANSYEVVPIGAQMEEADGVGSVFTEFDAMDPEQREALDANRAAARSHLSPSNTGSARASGGSSSGSNVKMPRRRSSALEREMLANRGASNRDRVRMARQLSNQSGGRVPFNMRYRVVEANVRDPRNAHLRRILQEGVEKKRSSFKRRHE